MGQQDRQDIAARNGSGTKKRRTESRAKYRRTAGQEEWDIGLHQPRRLAMSS